MIARVLSILFKADPGGLTPGINKAKAALTGLTDHAQKEGKRSGGFFSMMNETLGKKSSFYKVQKMMHGGGAMIGASMLGKTYLESTKQVSDLTTAFYEGTKSFAELRQEMMYAIPVFGKFIEGTHNLIDVLRGGPKVDAELSHRERNLDTAHNARLATRKGVDDFRVSTRGMIDKMSAERRALTPQPAFLGFFDEMSDTLSKASEDWTRARAEVEKSRVAFKSLVFDKHGFMNKDQTAANLAASSFNAGLAKINNDYNAVAAEASTLLFARLADHARTTAGELADRINAHAKEAKAQAKTLAETLMSPDEKLAAREAELRANPFISAELRNKELARMRSVLFPVPAAVPALSLSTRSARSLVQNSGPGGSPVFDRIKENTAATARAIQELKQSMPQFWGGEAVTVDPVTIF